MKSLFNLAGIGDNRLYLEWVSSAEGGRFAKLAGQVVSSVKKAGEFKPKDFSLELKALRLTLDGEYVRWAVGKEKSLTTQGDVYGRKWDEKEFQEILLKIAQKEYKKNLIFSAFQQDCQTVREVKERTGLDLYDISFLLTDLEKQGLVTLKGIENHKPIFSTT